jgi:hypothetical protein
MTAGWILVAGTSVVLALPVLLRAFQRRLDPFEPIVLFAVAWGIMFVVRPMATMTAEDPRYFGVSLRETLPVALLLAFVGAVAFVCGYELRLARALGPRAPAPRELDTRAAAVAAVAVAALGLAAFVVFLPTSDPRESLRIVVGGRGDPLRSVLVDSSTYVWYGSWLLAPAALVLAGLALRARHRLVWLVAGLVLALALVRTVPLGSRLVLLPLLGGLGVLVYVMRGRRPSARTLAGLAIVAIAASYVLVVVRDPEDRSGLGDRAKLVLERPESLFDPVLHGSDAEMVEALAGALTAVPDELGYRYGRATFGDLVTRPVPRELWSGKPLPSREKIVLAVWPSAYPFLNPAFSPLLSFYWDLGLTGVVLGMAALGVAARALYEWFLRHAKSFSAQLIFAATVWFVVIAARNDIVDTVVFALFLVVPVIAIVAVSDSRGALASWLRRRGPKGLSGSGVGAGDALRR